MIQKTLFAFVLSGFLFACGSTPETTQTEETQQEETTTETTEASKENAFGETFQPESYISYGELSSQMETSDSVSVQFVGTVQEVCQVKGCWMTIGDQANAEQTPIMVRFKDYGFFMPKDISGRQVIMNGYAYREVTSVDELKHYAEDAGKSQEEIDAITEPKEELKFLASGVVLLEEE